MVVAIRKMGNPQSVLILKPILAKLGLEGTAELQPRRRGQNSSRQEQPAWRLGRRLTALGRGGRGRGG